MNNNLDFKKYLEFLNNRIEELIADIEQAYQNGHIDPAKEFEYELWEMEERKIQIEGELGIEN